mmetsp:Transcript_19863/g.28929  ORF Transcript_19863/g.28929 Transcript_19863/m.28929 type:complete len:240 (-) Transcript_19863:2235-2954(-)
MFASRELRGGGWLVLGYVLLCGVQGVSSLLIEGVEGIRPTLFHHILENVGWARSYDYYVRANATLMNNMDPCQELQNPHRYKGTFFVYDNAMESEECTEFMLTEAESVGAAGVLMWSSELQATWNRSVTVSIPVAWTQPRFVQQAEKVIEKKGYVTVVLDNRGEELWNGTGMCSGRFGWCPESVLKFVRLLIRIRPFVSFPSAHESLATYFQPRPVCNNCCDLGYGDVTPGESVLVHVY